jgi:serine/threonine-protein kinase
MDRDAWRRLTDGEGSEYWSVFSPVDGKRVIFNSTRKNPSAATLFWKTLEAGGKIEELASSDYHLQPQSFTPDGKSLVYQEGSRPDTGFDIWKISLEGDRKPQPLIRTRFNEFHPAVSPDGHWLAYVTDEFGRSNVYVRTLVEEGQPLQVSTNGGIGPLWSPDGRQLYYRSPDGNSMMAVSFQGRPSFQIGKERTLFTGSFREDVMWGRNYDIAPDGRRFLMIQDKKPEPRQIVVVVNWFEELKRLCPTGK